MNLDGLLQEYFGTADLSGMTPAGQAAGIERMQVDLGLEKDRSRRFALYAENGVVRAVHVEEPGQFEVSSAEYMLAHLPE